jgi:transposase
MGLDTAFDLHSSNSYAAVIDKSGKRVMHKKLRNDPERIVDTLKGFKDNIAGIVQEKILTTAF